MHPFVVLIALSSMVCAACSGAILIQGRGSRTGLLGGVLLMGWSYWAACQVFFHAAADASTALIYAKAAVPGWIFTGPLCLQIFMAMGPTPARWRVVVLRASYAICGAVLLLGWTTPLLVEDMRLAPWGFNIVNGPLFWVVYVTNIGSSFSGLDLGFRAVRRLSEGELRQLPWFYASAALLLTASAVSDVLLPTLDIPFPPLGVAAFGVLAALTFGLLARFGYATVTPGNFATEILAILPDGVALLRPDETIRMANEGLARLVGIPREKLVGAPLGDLLTWSFDVDDRDELHAELEGASGHRIPVAVSSSLLRDRSGLALGRVLVLRDLREVADLRSRLITSARLAAVGELAAGIAHEINNPLSFVRSNLSQLDDRWKRVRSRVVAEPSSDERDEIAKDCDELIEESIEGVDRAVEIVRGVQSIAHVGSISREPTDLNSLLDDVLRVASAQLRNRVNIERDYAEIPPVVCTPQQIKQVFLNLVVNAAQAMEDGGRVRIETRQEDRDVIVAVEDDGCGIPPELIERVFDPFFTTKKVGEGTGLGLGIAHQIVEGHGGEIEVESNPGVRTVFRVRLPRGRA